VAFVPLDAQKGIKWELILLVVAFDLRNRKGSLLGCSRQ